MSNVYTSIRAARGCVHVCTPVMGAVIGGLPVVTVQVWSTNYTGPDTSCVPASSLIVRGIEFEWKDSDTVGSLADRIANELTDFDLNGSGGRHDVSSPTGTTPASTVRVSIASSAGVIQSRGNSMRRVAASGFSVVLSTRPMQGSSDTTRAVTNTETFYFRR